MFGRYMWLKWSVGLPTYQLKKSISSLRCPASTLRSSGSYASSDHKPISTSRPSHLCVCAIGVTIQGASATNAASARNTATATRPIVATLRIFELRIRTRVGIGIFITSVIFNVPFICLLPSPAQQYGMATRPPCSACKFHCRRGP